MNEDVGPAPATSLWQQLRAFYRGMARLGPAGVLTAIASVSPIVGGFVILGSVQHLAPTIRGLGVSGALLYVGSFWILGGFALVPTYAWAGLGGWTFGVVNGFAYAMAAFVGASWLGYALADRLGAERAMRVLEEDVKWQAVRRALVGQGFWRTLWVVTLLRLPPTSPFSFMCYVMAIARVPIVIYLLGALAGLAPRTLAVVVTFASLEQLDFEHPQQLWLRIAGIVATLVVVGIITQMSRKALREITGAPSL
jgi:uncharacterized membrane protein YdjX (TVP38/TMEM64 family)